MQTPRPEWSPSYSESIISDELSAAIHRAIQRRDDPKRWHGWRTVNVTFKPRPNKYCRCGQVIPRGKLHFHYFGRDNKLCRRRTRQHEKAATVRLLRYLLNRA